MTNSKRSEPAQTPSLQASLRQTTPSAAARPLGSQPRPNSTQVCGLYGGKPAPHARSPLSRVPTIRHQPPLAFGELTLAHAPLVHTKKDPTSNVRFQSNGPTIIFCKQWSDLPQAATPRREQRAKQRPKPQAQGGARLASWPAAPGAWSRLLATGGRGERRGRGLGLLDAHLDPSSAITVGTMLTVGRVHRLLLCNQEWEE